MFASQPVCNATQAAHTLRLDQKYVWEGLAYKIDADQSLGQKAVMKIQEYDGIIKIVKIHIYYILCSKSVKFSVPVFSRFIPRYIHSETAVVCYIKHSFMLYPIVINILIVLYEPRQRYQ